MLVKNKKQNKYNYKMIAVNEDVYGRLKANKNLYAKDTISDTIKAILDDWEYGIPIEDEEPNETTKKALEEARCIMYKRK